LIAASDIAARMRPLEPIGLGERGTNRLAWTAQDRDASAWFERQAADGHLRVERDPAGNLWACPEAPAPWWGVGSHLDTVRNGGRFDGALGVAAGFEVAARARVAVAVISFADEEGARFNTPTFGSRALVGRLDVADVIARTDESGLALADAMSGAGLDPTRLVDAPGWLARLRGFLELHIDQSRDLAEAGAAVGVVNRLAARLRLAVEVRGRASHSGTTKRADRRDALAAAARLIVTAEELAGADPGFVVTATRILVEPNALTTVPGRASVWLDARAADPGALHEWRMRVVERAAELGRARRVEIELRTASESPSVAFDSHVADALRDAATAIGQHAPGLVCYAGHDAGILADRLPSGMVLVRNETGISHAPEEHVELEDAARGADVLVGALERLG
jgi:N-carbamoyl-L-amino-acid hydrolase